MSEYIVCPHCYNPLSQSEYVKVMRCRDCKYYDDYTGCCTRRDYIAPMATTPDGFCAWAERREP